MIKFYREFREEIHVCLLAGGMVIGIFAALYSIIMSDTSEFIFSTEETIASVNGVNIPKSRYLEQLDAVRADRRDDLTREQERKILERLIDEELLIQNGLEVGFANSDRGVRSAIFNAVVTTVLTESETRQPDEDELKKFYLDNMALFTPEDKIVISRFVFNHSDPKIATEQAMQAFNLINSGSDFKKVSQSSRLTNNDILFVPKVAMPLTELREYFGPDVISVVKELKPGQVTRPLPSYSGSQILLINEVVPGTAPAFEENHERVEYAYRQAAGESALQDYLSTLRRHSKIHIME